MQSYRTILTLNTDTRRAYLNITPQVEDALAKSGISEGLCLVNAMNITASVFINDDENGLHRDFDRKAAQPVRPQRLRGQRGRAPEALYHGPRGRRRRNGRQAGFRDVGTDLLRRIRWYAR